MKLKKVLTLVLIIIIFSIGAIANSQLQEEIGDLILSADSEGDGEGKIRLQTNSGVDRIVIENDGSIIIGRMGIDEPKITFSTLESTVGWGLSINHVYVNGLRNDLAQFGYNCGAKTSAVIRKFCIEMETQYRGNGGEWAEFHLKFNSGLEDIDARPLSFAFNWLTRESIFQHNGNFSVADHTGTIGRFYVGGGAIQSTNSTPFLIGNNNFAGIKQRANIPGVYYTLTFLDSLNNINIGANGENRPVNIHGQLNVSSSGIYVNGQKVLGNRCNDISNSNGTDADNKRAINSLLACLRDNHQLIAQ